MRLGQAQSPKFNLPNQLQAPGSQAARDAERGVRGGVFGGLEVFWSFAS